MNKSLIVIGGGGHASVLLSELMLQGRKVIAIVAPEIDSTNECFASIQHLAKDEYVFKYKPDEVELINGIGSIPGANSLRRKLFNYFSKEGYSFSKCISERAILSHGISSKNAVQIMAGAIVQTGTSIGVNSIVNTGTIIEHDCSIGNFSHIAPGVVLSGGVSIGDNVHVGTGAVVIQNVNIANGAVISAGAIVTKNVGENEVVYGYRYQNPGQ